MTIATTASAPIVHDVVTQHLEEAVHLGDIRGTFVHAPHVTPWALRRLDDRLAAHLDGLAVAAENGRTLSEAALELPSRGSAFTALALAVMQQDHAYAGHLVSSFAGAPECASGIVAALGWSEPDQLRGIVARLLKSGEACVRRVGVAACAVHRVDPGFRSTDIESEPDTSVRARMLRTGGELGRQDVRGACLAAISDDDSEIRWWAAYAAVLLGDRNRALAVLSELSDPPSPYRVQALSLALQALSVPESRALLQTLARDSDRGRWLIQGTGIAGDPAYVNWLIGQMASVDTARVAGEAFSLITGADLDTLQLYAERPAEVETGPSEDPADEQVDLDPDEGLPWPDQKKVERWWAGNSSRFQKGTRYFVGAPLARSHCIDVLRTGYQRQRILAARYLCLLDPGARLFNTSAPAWRQQSLLARME